MTRLDVTLESAREMADATHSVRAPSSTRVAYIAAPLSGPTRAANIARAERWAVFAAHVGYAPVCSWVTLAKHMAETPQARARGLAIDVALVARCDEVWLVGGCISHGMQIEATAAKEAGIEVLDMHTLVEAPPLTSPLAAELRARAEKGGWR